MKRIIIVTTIFVFAVLAAGSVSATSSLSSTIYVSPDGDDDNDGLTSTTPVKTINVGISKVTENGRVNLAAGTYNKTGKISKDVDITINKNLTIAGAGKGKTIIDGLGASQIFNIESGTVLIKDITFQNARLDNSGGAISSDGTLTIKNCAFKNNTAVDDGGGALFTHTTLNVVDCVFIGNTADAGGAIFNKHGTLTVTGSTFINNKAKTDLDKYSGGGAIFNYYDSSYRIVGNTFLNNEASAIHIAQDSSEYSEKSYESTETMALINLNRIVGNTEYGIYLETGKPIKRLNTGSVDYKVDATNNWWGSNSNPKNNPHNIGGDIDSVMADPWLVLTLSTNPSSISYGSTATVTAKITQNSNGQDTSGIGHIPDGTPITITTDIGNVGSKSVTKYTVDGMATAILRADDGYGTANLYAILDNFQTTLPSQVTIVKAAIIEPNDINTQESQIIETNKSRSIPLQKTGMPLFGVLMATLMILGGLTSKR